MNGSRRERSIRGTAFSLAARPYAGKRDTVVTVITNSDSPASALLDPTQLRTFLAVAQTLNFTAAAQRLGTSQSTVSQHMRKLEEAAGRALFTRDTHSVALTADGEAMIGFAQAILEGNERAVDYFAGAQLRGRVRFGTSEDFAHSRLPEMLRTFRATHPLVELELTVGLSGGCIERLEARRTRPGAGEAEGRGDARHAGLAGRDGLDRGAGRAGQHGPWRAGAADACPEPSISRELAMRALERAGRSWRIACTAAVSAACTRRRWPGSA